MVVPSAKHADAALALDKVTYKSAAGGVPPFSRSVQTTATRDAGQRVVGGGVRVDDPAHTFVDDAYPDGPNAWTVRVGSNWPVAIGYTVIAICAAITTTG